VGLYGGVRHDGEAGAGRALAAQAHAGQAARATAYHTSPKSINKPHHRLNMEVDLKVYLGSMSRDVHSCRYSLAATLQPPPILPHWDSYTRALLVSKDRRHLFVTPPPLNHTNTQQINQPACMIYRKARIPTD
jgi:hypothetical protein